MVDPSSLREIPMREWNWSPAEKAVAQKAFDKALGQELESVVREAKERVARITKASELWDLEDWLKQRRRQIDRTYDFRYSVLPEVFAFLIREGRLAEIDLGGLAPAKLELIRKFANAMF